MYGDLKSSFAERNNQLVRDVDSSVDRRVLVERFLQLSSDIQSVPVQSMFSELELGVVSNLLAITWLREETGAGVETGVRSLIRLLQSSAPSREVKPDVDYNTLIDLLLQQNLWQRISANSFEDLFEIVGFLVLNKTSDRKLVENYSSWLDKMRICQDEISVVTVGSLDHRQLLKIIPPRELQDEKSVSVSEVLRLMVKIKANHGPVVISGTDQISVLLEAAKFYKEGNRRELCECLSKILEKDNIIRQPELITKYFLILKGNLLVEESKYQRAFGVFGQVISVDPANIEAYVGVAKCFERMGKMRNELDIWKIICHLQHQKTSQSHKPDETATLDLGSKILSTFFPVVRHSLVENLLKFARKCQELGEYEDSADNYLDVLALEFSHQVSLENKVEVQQEAVLSLLLDNRLDLSLALLHDIINRPKTGRDGSKRGREAEEDSLRTVINYFLFGLFYVMNGDHHGALRSFNTSLQLCHMKTEQLKQKQKRRKLESEAVCEADGDIETLDIVRRLRARLYAEKSLVYHDLGDTSSSISSIKAALKFCYSQVYLSVYCKYLNRMISEEEQHQLGDPASASVMNSTRHNDDICISYIITTSTLRALKIKK